MRWFAALLTAGWIAPAWTLPGRAVPGRFLTSPANAGVYQEVSSPELSGRYLGQSDHLLWLDVRGTQLHLIFRAPGYQDYHLKMAPGYFYQHSQWPEQGMIELIPARWDTWLSAHLRGILLLAGLSLLLPGLARRRRAPAPIGGYHLLGLLGRGGSARVYRAVPLGQDSCSREAVAIKIYQNSMGEPANLGAHPGIVQIYHHGRDRGTDYVVMELLPGKTLRSAMRAGGIERTRAIRWIGQILAALEFAHQHDVLHGDLKPENILIAEDGSLKLTDFADSTSPQGTPAYFAPEQLLNKPVGVWTDQYGLGLLCFELLTGRLPSGGLTRSIQPFESGQLEGPLEATLERMLATEPQHRFPTIHEAGQALLEHL